MGEKQEVTDWEADHQPPDKDEIKWKKPADTTWIRFKDKQIEELKKKIKEGGDKDEEIKKLKKLKNQLEEDAKKKAEEDAKKKTGEDVEKAEKDAEIVNKNKEIEKLKQDAQD